MRHNDHDRHLNIAGTELACVRVGPHRNCRWMPVPLFKLPADVRATWDSKSSVEIIEDIKDLLVMATR